MEDLSYDELVWHERPRPAAPLLTGLAVLVVLLLGAPQVWQALRSGDPGYEVVFFVVLAVALGPAALRRSAA